MAKTKRNQKGGGGRGSGKKGSTNAAVPSASAAPARKRVHSSGDDDALGAGAGGTAGEQKTDVSVLPRRSARQKALEVPVQYRQSIGFDDDDLDDSDVELDGYPSSGDDDDLLFESDEDEPGDEDDDDDKKPAAKSTGKDDKPQKKKNEKSEKKKRRKIGEDGAPIRSDQQLREYLEKNKEYQKGRSKEKDAELIERLMATTKKSLEMCSSDAILFVLGKAKRRGFLDGDIQHPLDAAVWGFCEYVVTSYPPALAEKIVQHFEDLRDHGRLGMADTLTVAERVGPFAAYELDCSGKLPKPTQNSDCTNYVICCEPADVIDAAKDLLSEGAPMSERNRTTMETLLLPTAKSMKSVSYIGETLQFWLLRCKANFVGYVTNRILHRLLQSRKFRVIAINMDPAFQSNEVSEGIKKKRLLGIEMIWHINELGFAIQGQKGSMCKVYGGGIRVTDTTTRLYQMLEDPTRFPDGHHDLVEWVKCNINGEDQHIIRIKSFNATNELREEMNFPYLNRWLAQNHFRAVLPPNMDLNDVVEDEDENPEASLSAFNGRTSKSKLSTGALHYYNELFQPGNVLDIFLLKRDPNRSIVPLEDNLAGQVFSAYLSSSKKTIWDKEKRPMDTVAYHLAMLVAKVIDIQVGTLNVQLAAKFKEHGGNETSICDIDEDDPMLAAMLAFDYTHTTEYAYRNSRNK